MHDDSDGGDAVTARLFVRSLGPGEDAPDLERLRERLETLVERDLIREYSVYIWGKHVSPSAAEWTETGRFVLDTVEQFEAWAERDDVSLDPFFGEETRRSAIRDQAERRIRLPTVALAEYEGDDLRFVAPCVADGTLRSVEDRLGELLAGALSEADGEGRKEPAPVGGERP